mgnify:CR=1 FL=1
MFNNFDKTIKRLEEFYNNPDVIAVSLITKLKNGAKINNKFASELIRILTNRNNFRITDNELEILYKSLDKNNDAKLVNIKNKISEEYDRIREELNND